MPLPAALAARLAKRGIISAVPQGGIEEEVFAEDYDDPSKEPIIDRIKPVAEETKREQRLLGHHGCPNKWNIFHDCTPVCIELWGNGKQAPSLDYDIKRQRMLSLYPLLEHWKEEYDSGTGRCYYWNIKTEEVSWLSPAHPKAVVSASAAVFRENIRKQADRKAAPVSEKDRQEDEDSDQDDEDIEERRRKEREERREKREKERAKGRSKAKENDLDPMDPASYSDIPRGSWSTGLALGNEAKTGADATASGPLFQMRPYPNPGAVLRANAKVSKRHEDDD